MELAGCVAGRKIGRRDRIRLDRRRPAEGRVIENQQIFGDRACAIGPPLRSLYRLALPCGIMIPHGRRARHCLKFMPKRGTDAENRIFFDELVSIAASRLRATGVIRLEDKQALIPFGEQTKLIGVAHTKFPNGGSWSYFLCPKCGRRAKKLWLVDGAPSCRLCLEKLGVRNRAAYGFGRSERLRERDRRVDKLQAMLEGVKWTRFLGPRVKLESGRSV